MSRSRVVLLFLLFAGLVPTGAWAQVPAPSTLSVRDAWVRATMAGRQVTGGFLVIENTGAAPRALVSASADVAAPVELHEMKRDGAMMRMSPVKQIEVPAGGRVELKPGSFHLMLYGLKVPLTAGQTATLTLLFDDGTKLVVNAQVRVPGGTW